MIVIPCFLSLDSDNWDPYSNHFADNKNSILDNYGNMRNKKRITEHTLDMNTATPTNQYETAVDRTPIHFFCVCPNKYIEDCSPAK